MKKKHIVSLSDRQRETLARVVKCGENSASKIRRAHILLKADENGPGWTDKKIAEAFDCTTQTVENVRQRLHQNGLEETVQGKAGGRGRPKLLDGEQEAQLIAMRLGEPPKGYGTWSLRLLRERFVELDIGPDISHETVRQTLKKMWDDPGETSLLGDSAKT